MLFPFELGAAILVLEAVRQTLALIHDSALHRSDPWLLVEGAWRVTSPLETVAAFLALLALSWLLNAWATRRMEWRIRQFFRREDTRVHPTARFERDMFLVHAGTVGAYGAFLFYFQWPVQTLAWPWLLGLDVTLGEPWARALAHGQTAGAILDLGPYLMLALVGWRPQYDLRRRLDHDLSWFGFLRSQLLPWLPFLGLWCGLHALLDGLALLPEASVQTLDASLAQPAGELTALAILLGILLLVSCVLAPSFLVWAWKCKPFPPGDLYDRFQALVKRSGVRARAILLWGPWDVMLQTACILGPWRRFRYILISPFLTERLEPRECEAVIAHELGHAKYGHLSLLIGVMLLLAAVGSLAMSAGVRLSGAFPLGSLGSVLAYLLPLLAILALFIRGFFGAVSRACEREADLASAEMMGDPEPIISSLEKVGLMAGDIRTVYVWHHDSIANRVEHVRACMADPARARACHRGVLLYKLLVWLGLAGCGAALFLGR